MFIIESQHHDNLSNRLKVMLEQMKKTFVDIPPHFKLLVALNPTEAENTLKYLFRLMQHSTIPTDLFAFIRLYVASQEGYKYCIHFNSKLLQTRGYSDESIEKVRREISSVPFDNRIKRLAEKGIKAVYSPSDFNLDDLKDLYYLNWNDEEIFEVINHAAFLFKNGKIISAYLK